MATRHRIASREDLPEDGSRVLAEIDGIEVALFRIEGEFYALANHCIHQGGPVCEGDLTGRVSVGEDRMEWTYDGRERNVLCPWHGWTFDVTTGRNANDDRYSIPTYDVEVEDDDIYVLL